MYQCSVVNNLIASLKSSYFTSIIEAHSNDQKVLFKTVNKLLQKKTFRCYASARSNDVLANRFVDFFHEKISTIRRDLQATIDYRQLTRHHILSLLFLLNRSPNHATLSHYHLTLSMDAVTDFSLL